MLKKLFLFQMLFISVFFLFGCKQEIDVVVTDTMPIITGDTSMSHVYGTEFDPLEGVTANDQEDGNLTSSIVVVSNTVDIYSVGFYTVKLSITDTDDNSVSIIVIVEVVVPLANYAEGVDLSHLDIKDKGILFSALEEYLLENVYGGVPLFRKANYVMFSSRTKLYSPTYNGVLGFGSAFSQFTEDDSNILMYGEEYGNAGEYTWRDDYSTDPVTLNPWISDDSETSDLIKMFTGGLYELYFDNTKTGYELNPSLASVEPIAIDAEVIDGTTYSSIWQIPLIDDLEWTFHPDTDTSGYNTGFEVLDASDYLWTWETAMSEGWFRAKSGGGDFITQGVKNASEYINGTITDFDEVGLRMATGETNVLEIEFITSKSAFEVKYMFSGSSFSPINKELYESAEAGLGYGLTPETVASSGVYCFDTWNLGQFLLLTKNDLHPDSSMYHYTHYRYNFIDGANQILEEFIAGRLDSAPVPLAEAATYYNDSRVISSPDPTTWRLNINAFGTVENRDAYSELYPESNISEDWVPEPILMYLEMRQALYYGFDRYDAAVNVVHTYEPAFTLLEPTYFIDGESGVSIRGTESGTATLTKFGGDTYGYLPSNALNLFKSASEQAIDDGYYEKGTSDNYTEIVLELFYSSSGNESMQTMASKIKQQYEELLVDNDNFIKVVINVYDVAFPSSYYDHSMNSFMDLCLGGVSSYIPRTSEFRDIYGDNNKSGLTLNWGIDTHTPNIQVTYNNLEGMEVSEIWSYNALVTALNEKTYIRDGNIQTTWDNIDDLIETNLEMASEELVSSIDGSELSQYILGDTLEYIATENDFDGLFAHIVSTNSGRSILYVISSEDLEYKLYRHIVLFDNVEDAIIDHSEYPDYFVSASGPLTDAEIATNEYVITNFPSYETLSDVATAQESPLLYTEVWTVEWDTWSDIYVVLHIGDYYLGWSWI